MPVKIGKVFLVGAGPGDPALITIKAIKCLQKADVVIYDQLVAPQLLGYTSPQAERIYVGKSGDKHTAEQDEINLMLAQLARRGKIVVRLKGGDPFVFGRGGEEADFLCKNALPFEIVPGITSAIAVPAYAGIPVTYRGISSSLAIVTGHEDPRKSTSSINWRGLAAGVDTLIFLMGMQNLALITDKLVECGKPPDTPVAVIKDGTLPAQVIVKGSLQTIAAQVRKKRITAPAVIVIGNVVKLSERLNWYPKLSLFGRRVLITRAGLQSADFEAQLFERGAVPVKFPMIEIKAIKRNSKLDTAIKQLGSYDWIIFTSVNGVDIFFQRLQKHGLDARALSGTKIGAIGPATSRLLENRGVVADYIPVVYTAQGIVDGIKSQSMQGKRVLIPRADIADDELVQGLTRMKAKVDNIHVYRTVRPEYDVRQFKKLVLDKEIDIITFTSSSTVKNFIAVLNSKEIAKIRAIIACIGPKTAMTASNAGFRVNIVAKKQTLDGLLREMEDYFREDN
ncbi:MAG: uroporphyrinogen-III C-methyltransferase [Dehalococcoidia bacterium]|nr:uroporphyrinogen-III C-methyltransferase [Dehalococcoidia bacterium]